MGVLLKTPVRVYLRHLGLENLEFFLPCKKPYNENFYQTYFAKRTLISKYSLTTLSFKYPPLSTLTLVAQ